MTTRKAARAARGWRALPLLAGLGLAGCATPGPLHLYSLGPAGSQPVRDAGPSSSAEVPSHVAAGETVVGLGYDPFTDHLFLRLAPGSRVRVVDRPAGTVKREWELAEPGARHEADLAVRPRDGHVFLLAVPPGRVLEVTRLGRVVRQLDLAAAGGPPVGLAYDPVRDRLLVLSADGRSVSIHALDGARVDGFALAEAARDSLAYDGRRRELFSPLRDRAGLLGVFDASGRLLRTIPSGDATRVDVGERSLLRVF